MSSVLVGGRFREKIFARLRQSAFTNSLVLRQELASLGVVSRRRPPELRVHAAGTQISCRYC